MRRAQRILAWALGAVLLSSLLLVTAVFIAGNTAAGRKLIEQETAAFTKGRVRLGGLSGSFPSAIHLGQLQLSDERGVWLTAERATIRWSPRALLARHVNIELVRVERLDIERRPITQPQKKSSRRRLPSTDIQQLQIEDLDLGEALAGTRASLSVNARGHLESLNDATATFIARRTDGQGRYELALHFDRSRMNASLKVEEAAGGTLASLLKYPGLGALSVSAELSGSHAAERIGLTARAGDLHARVDGTVNLTEETANVAYRLDSPAMTPRPGLSWHRASLQGELHGALEAPRGDGRLQIFGLRTPGGVELADLSAYLDAARGFLSVRAIADGVVVPGPTAKLLSNAPLRLSATMQLNDATHPLQLTADHRLFSLRMRATTGAVLGATFHLHLPNLAAVAALAHQRLEGTADLEGTVKQSATATRLTLDGNTEVAADARGVLSRVMKGSSRLQLIAALTDRALEVEHLSLSGRMLSASLSGSAERGATRAASPVRTVHARYTANLSDLNVLAPALRGALTLSGQLEGPIDSIATQSEGQLAGAPLQLDVAMERLAGGALHVVMNRAEWKSARIQGDFATAASLANGHGTLQLRVDHLADLQPLLGTSLGGSVVLTAAGPMDAMSLQMAVQSPDVWGQPASLDASGQLNLVDCEMRLQRTEARYRGQSAQLLAPARLSFAQGLQISQLKVGVQRAVLALDGQIFPDLDVHASARHVDAGLLNTFVPGVVAEGAADADARLQGTLATPSGVMTVKANGLRFAGTAARDLAPIDVDASAHLTGQATHLVGQLDVGGSRLTLNGGIALSADGALNLKLEGNLDAALLNPMLEAQGRRAAGTFAVNGALTGTLQAPQIAGTVDLTHGDLRDYSEGLHLADITAHLIAAEGALRIERLVAHAAPGEITMTGSIGVLQPQIPIDIHVVANNAQPITSDIITANLNATLDLKGTLRQRLDLSGEIRPKRAVIGIPSGMPREVAVLDVRRPGDTRPAPRERPLVIGLDLRIHAPRAILVQGRGLDAELAGDLQIAGTTDTPRIDGAFDMVRGTFQLVGTNLTFTSGRVSFNGAGLQHKINPTLDFTAQATVASATATLHITGLADAPQFELSSDPQLPQDEILARLLFGETAAQLSPLQLAALGPALATLSGVGAGGGGINPVAKVQKVLGLDRLSISGGGNTPANGSATAPVAQSARATTVQAGRYVFNRVYVGARQSTTGASQVEVDVDLSKRLQLQTRLGNGSADTQGTTPENDPGSSIGLAYQIEY